jgi:hypothetical protein
MVEATSINWGGATMANQEKQEELVVNTDEAGRLYVRVDRSRAEILRDYLSENGFSSTHIEDDACDRLRFGYADPEEIQALLDEWPG